VPVDPDRDVGVFTRLSERDNDRWAEIFNETFKKRVLIAATVDSFLLPRRFG
jgi:hypothetical protein